MIYVERLDKNYKVKARKKICKVRNSLIMEIYLGKYGAFRDLIRV